MSTIVRSGVRSGGENRRGFVEKLVALVLYGAGLCVPLISGLIAFLNPLRQRSAAGEYFKVTTLDALPTDGSPMKFTITADRVDAWNRTPNQPIGAIFVRRVGEKVEAFQVICPHAGCTINFERLGGGGRFFCPCHAASFDLSGRRLEEPSQSPRDMDSLDWEIRNGTEVWVKYETFVMGSAQKKAQA